MTSMEPAEHQAYIATRRCEYEPLPPALLAAFQHQAADLSAQNKCPADWWEQTAYCGRFMEFDPSSPLWPWLKKLVPEARTIGLQPNLSKGTGRWLVAGQCDFGGYENTVPHERIAVCFADYKAPMRLFVEPRIILAMDSQK